MLNFENFLRKLKPRHYQKQIGNNTAMKHIQRLRRMVTLAYHIEWIDNDSFRKFRKKLTATNRGFLTPEELKRVEELHFGSVQLRTVRNLFVFSCYTGISFSDLMALTQENVVMGLDGAYGIITQRQKN